MVASSNNTTGVPHPLVVTFNNVRACPPSFEEGGGIMKPLLAN